MVSEVLWHSPETSFTASAQATILFKEIILLELVTHPPEDNEIAEIKKNAL